MDLAKEGESLFDAINPLQDNMDDYRLDKDGEAAFEELMEQNKFNKDDADMGFD